MSLEISELVDLLILDMKADFLILCFAEIDQIMQKMIIVREIGLIDPYHWTGHTEIVQGITSSMRGKDTRDDHHLLCQQHFLHVASGVVMLGREVVLHLEAVHYLKIIVEICT